MPHAMTKHMSLCTLRQNGDIPVMRCEHCGTELPMEMKFPVPVTELTAIGEAFITEHRYCALSLLRLREMERMTREVMVATSPSRKVYDTHRAELYRIQATIRRLEPDTNKWPK